METKILIASIFAALFVGTTLVAASSYYSMAEFHQRMMSSDDFAKMHAAMMSGDHEAAEKYHENLDFECPMHELIEEGKISDEDFRTMHEWMMTGNFPDEKPEGLNDAAWEIHKSHHPEIYDK
ncbi:MAG: hypothetical protein GXO64_02430 [Candidatus Micrarchaeota archaeon]|nr:hypothetical protein [Candidatus Micrarchaeota archaeon]